MFIHIPTMTYPVKESQIKAKILQSAPNTSFAKPFLPPAEYARVFESTKPSFDPIFQSVDEGVPVEIDGVWMQKWNVRAATPEEIGARLAVLQQGIVAETQKRLDDFALTRAYDGIMSACTYATSAVPKFRNEGQYCVNARDATWAKLYSIMDDVMTGKRTIPAGYADIEADLPPLEWPA